MAKASPYDTLGEPSWSSKVTSWSDPKYEWAGPTLSIPDSWIPLMEAILRWFNNQQYPVWCPFFKHDTRSAKKRNLERTYLPSVAAAWGLLNAATKALWATAADFGTLNRYQLFTSDYCYRRKNGLSLPGTPNIYHQLHGMQMGNPGGLEVVRLRRDEKDLVGPVTISFNYKQIDSTPEQYEAAEWADVVAAWADASYRWTKRLEPSWGSTEVEWADSLFQWSGPVSFGLLATLYYFDEGQNKTVSESWACDPGNIDWTTKSITFGVAGRKYFHLTLLFTLDHYDAQVSFDRFLIEDQNGDIYRESWQYKAGKVWTYDNLYRKSGWLFTPGYREPFFEVVYLG